MFRLRVLRGLALDGPVDSFALPKRRAEAVLAKYGAAPATGS